MAILWGFFSVFPANAGMIPDYILAHSLNNCVPRECGDDPHKRNIVRKITTCSPRMRG